MYSFIMYNLGMKPTFESTTDTVTKKAVTASTDAITIHPATEMRPAFPGGETAMKLWIINNVTKSTDASQIVCMVFVDFTVEADGSLSDVKSSKEMSTKSGEEAVRLVKAMPKWLPYFQSGVATSKGMQITINFSM
jgi:periplasmic protein TonB